MVCIYKISSPSGKVYIGQTWNFKARMNIYKNANCFKQPKLYQSLKKYGFDKHEIYVLQELPLDTKQYYLDQYEILYIELHKSCGCSLLNIKDGGSNGKHSEETKEKLRASNTGFKHSEETKVIIKEKRSRQVITESHRQKIKEANTGRVFGQAFKDKMSAIRKGVVLSDETKGKLSFLNKKVVYQFSLDGVYIDKWDSCKDASISLNICESNINACARGIRKRAKNYKFSYSLS